MNETILIIDDDEKLNGLLERFLKKYGFRTLAAPTPSQGLELLEKKDPDLIILDVMLPQMSGFDVCRKIRRTHDVPIIMLTARGEVTDRIVGLELGADDYLPKPFEPRELAARIQSVLRRSAGTRESRVARFGDLTIDFAKKTAILEAKPLDLTTNEFNALEMLARHAGEVLDRDRLLNRLRGMDCDAFNRAVDITVSRLRQKLGDDPRRPRWIRTVWGAGYVFIGETGGEDHGDL